MAKLRATYEHARATLYVRPGGPWDVPGLDLGLSGQAVEVVDGDRHLDAAALGALVSETATWLHELGITLGSVVAWQSPNRLESYVLYRACWRLGAVPAPLHHGAGQADVDAALAQLSPDVTIASSGMPLAHRADVIVFDTALPTRSGPIQEQWPPVDPAAVAAVLFTSGSSGTPKAVMHTHRGLLCKARTMAAVHALSPSDAVLMPAPLAHISGLLNGVLVPGAVGMKTVLMRRWDPSVALELIGAEAVTFMIGPPTFFVSLMEAPGFSPDRVASLRLVSSGGAGVSPAFVERATASLHCRVKRTYGSTEAPTVTTSAAEDPVDRARDTDGRATPDAEVRVVDPVTGHQVAPGEIGEVWLRGPELFVGYVDAAATSEAFADGGWYRTDDLGVLDDNGWLTITGRLKDMIIRGGENISAAEVESVLEQHPRVSQAVAVGYADDRLGQRVCAFVVADGVFDLQACRRWMDDRGVTKFKWPERVIQVDSLPLLASGKVDRAALGRSAAQ